MAEVTLIEAVNMALAHEMAVDDSVVVLGEDVGVNGGVFRATLGLQERFGKNRVLDTPLSETLIAGMAIGLGVGSWYLYMVRFAGMEPWIGLDHLRFGIVGAVASVVSMVPLVYSNSQSPPRSAAPVPFVLAATSAPLSVLSVSAST